MTFVVENLRLKELAIVASQNKPAFDDLLSFLRGVGYCSLHAFVMDGDAAKAEQTILAYLHRPLPRGIALFDGIARPYKSDKAKWLLLGWVLRDAPEQRLRPMISSMPGQSTSQKQAYLLNRLRGYVASIFPEPSRWEWTSISEVVIDRLEGSRRAIKGTLFEVIVRRVLKTIFADHSLELTISESEIRLDGETYDVCVTGPRKKYCCQLKLEKPWEVGMHCYLQGIFTNLSQLPTMPAITVYR